MQRAGRRRRERETLRGERESEADARAERGGEREVRV